ncbi:uncharacterized protein LOC110095136 [Dendrobium catenatum]|uniref:Uncharacterized protein n=1 Tax=Dendrobium catenatum TaxID=906689 RepID=A0A2I0WTU7_9ASPA|nr:uncharacterized protein LOC110095136 [Dendrobium catenatum]PKU79076.1 hypothetical protein MA16_Dca000420 [Dendrobium catenatum]
MKLVWCPETAFKAYIDTVKAAQMREDVEDSAAAELVAAMAGGWNAKLIVEAWVRGGGATTSVGLSEAARHTCGRHVCVLPDEDAAEDYAEVVGSDAAEVVVGEAEEVMRELKGVELLVVDWRRRDAARIVREVRPGVRGMVVVCRHAGGGKGRPELAVADDGRRVVRTVYLPVGSGVQILHVGVGKGATVSGGDLGRWIRHVDRKTGEEHVFRRR